MAATTDVWAALKATPKVAIIEPTPQVLSKPVYSIHYWRYGRSDGQSLARGDQLDEWRCDLAADGWDVRLRWELRGQPAPDGFLGGQESPS